MVFCQGAWTPRLGVTAISDPPRTVAAIIPSVAKCIVGSLLRPGTSAQSVRRDPGIGPTSYADAPIGQGRPVAKPGPYRRPLIRKRSPLTPTLCPQAGARGTLSDS